MTAAASLLALGTVLVVCMVPTLPSAASPQPTPLVDLTPNLPPDVPGPLSDESVRRYAWQSFIALNWPAKDGQPGKPDPVKHFGTASPVVWETYKSASEVFLPDAGKPARWDTRKALPAAFAALQAESNSYRLRVMDAPSKVLSAADVAHILPKIPEWQQATGGKPWLTDQRGQLVWYDLLMNEDEFNYIVQKELYDPAKQHAAMAPGGHGISLPAGKTDYGPLGAIEVKASWRVISAEAQEAAKFYTTDALILNDPRKGPDGGYTPAKLGLVGLHIIHKTPQAPQFIWATFEHVDNCPTRNQVEPGRTYSFFDHTSTDAPNVPPLPTQALDKAIQVIREVPIPDAVRELNEAAWAVIRAENPESVWLQYQLIDAQWPQSGTTIPARAQTPLSMGGPTPQRLSNTTAETYVQRTRSCLNCHRFATIARTQAVQAPVFAADYSFLFVLAKEKTN